jgi:hypothetical protein
MSSRLRAVRIFTIAYPKTNVFGVPPELSMPAAGLPLRSRLHGLLIFEQDGALVSTPCAFRLPAALEPSLLDTSYNV